MSIDRGGKRLRFHGGEQRAAWDLALPESRSMFRTANPLHRGWAWGHLLVLRVGSELFGVAPFNEQGDPKASVVWRGNMYGARTTKWNQLGVRIVPSPAGFGLDEVALVDRFGRELGQVGPVQPGYLCYRDQARLVAIDTATGVRLWERHGVPPGVVVAGGAEQLILAKAGSDQIDVLRALDGRLVRTSPAPIGVETVLRWYGTRGLSLADQRLRLIDFAEGRTMWERPVEPKSLPFAFDETRCGLVEADGTFHLIRLADGTTLNAVKTDSPMSLDRVFSTLDERHCYIALGGPFKRPDHQRVQQDRGGFRSPPVSGRLLAVSRETGRVPWNMPLEDAALPHEQPRETPFLVIHHWRADKAPNGAETQVCVQRLWDKRTGAELHHSTRAGELGWYVIDPNVDQRRIELRDAQQTVRVKWE